MNLIGKPINWTGSKVVEAKSEQSISITKEEARQRFDALQNQISIFITESQALYKEVPTSELGGIILLAENIERELEKLK